jgi:hypothetical protein
MISALTFFSTLKWIDGTPLQIEDSQLLHADQSHGRVGQ